MIIIGAVWAIFWLIATFVADNPILSVGFSVLFLAGVIAIIAGILGKQLQKLRSLLTPKPDSPSQSDKPYLTRR